MPFSSCLPFCAWMLGCSLRSWLHEWLLLLLTCPPICCVCRLATAGHCCQRCCWHSPVRRECTTAIRSASLWPYSRERCWPKRTCRQAAATHLSENGGSNVWQLGCFYATASAPAVCLSIPTAVESCLKTSWHLPANNFGQQMILASIRRVGHCGVLPHADQHALICWLCVLTWQIVLKVLTTRIQRCNIGGNRHYCQMR